ncbi:MULTISPECIES: transposase [Nocardia]|uniref:transposase n=1 Tax=Nocardia TaxID=1817 RepID=UPI001E4CE3FA|nr:MULTISPECIES: transposase [Nocardia]UEX20794.1 transposase [Nocardia farcinica]
MPSGPGSNHCFPARKRHGRPSRFTRRQLIDGIRWRVRVGAPWRDIAPCCRSWQSDLCPVPALGLGTDPAPTASPRRRRWRDRLDGWRGLDHHAWSPARRRSPPRGPPPG